MHINLKIFFTSLSFLILLLPLSALDLTVEEAVETALEQNLQLKAEEIAQKTLEREKNSVWNEFLPEASAGIGMIRTNSLDNGYPEFWNAAATVSASLDLSSTTYLEIKDTIADYQKGLISLEIAQKQLSRDVKKAFYYIILLRETIILTEDMIDTAFQRYERAKVNYELGNIAYVEVLTYQVAWENMKPELINQKNQLDTSLLEFKRLLGIDLEENLNIIGEIETEIISFDSEKLIEESLFKRLEIQYYTKIVDQVGIKKNKALSQSITPVLGLAYTWMPVQNDPFHSEWNDYDGGFQLSLTLPLDGYIPNSKKNLLVKEYKDIESQAQILLENEIRGNAIDIQSSVLKLNKSASTIDSLVLNVKLALENYNLVDSSYTEGLLDFLDVQNADDELNKARLMVLDEKFNYISALMDLQYIINSEDIQ